MGAFRARFGGRCHACGEQFPPGAEVMYVEDELVHAECEDAALSRAARRRPAEVCTECWLEKPCPCDDERRPA